MFFFMSLLNIILDFWFQIIFYFLKLQSFFTVKKNDQQI